MAGQLWKYDSIRGLYHMEDGLDAKNSNDITLFGTSTVPGKLNNAQNFDGIDDHGVANGLIAALANDTKGTIALWDRLDTDNGAVQYIYAVSEGSTAARTEFVVLADFATVGNPLQIACTVDGVTQYNIRTATTDLSTLIGGYASFIIKHNETEISEVKINNVPQTLNFLNSTVKASWMKAIITDAIDKSDTVSFGAVNVTGSFVAFMDGALDETAIVGDLWDSDDDDAFWGGGAGQEIFDPSLINLTTTGIATAARNGLQGIDVSMPYSGDDNTDSTYTVDYRIVGGVNWINWVSNSPNTPSPFLTTITGLVGGNTYEVRITYIDPDGVTGENPQIITGIFMPVPVVPIITTHNQDAKNRLLEQYKKEPGIEGLIESYFGNQIQDLEDVLQLFFDRLNIDISEGVQLDGIGKIVNQDRLGLTDELYRLFLKGRIGANVSEGDIERLIEVWKTITQANIVKLEEIFPAEVNLATDVALPDNLIDIAFALIQNVSGAGVGVGVTTFLPEDAFSFDGADLAITKGFGELISIGITDGTTTNKLVDSGASFDTDGVIIGMVAMNDTDGTEANVILVTPTELTLDADIFTTGEDYYINANTGGKLAKIQGAN